MKQQHLQTQGLDAWREASDDAIISALNDLPEFVNVHFWAYVQAERPSCLRSHLHAIRYTGGTPARRREER